MDKLDFWQLLAGLGIFLFGISRIESDLESLASHKFKRLLEKHTNSHLKSILIGTFSTALLQSSSAVTLMLLALVGSGVLQFSHAVGIILGANLGTTFTGWIISTFGFKVNISKAIYPMIGIGSILHLFFERSEKIKRWGSFILGIGLLFFGLNLMKDSVSQLQESFNISSFADYHYLTFALFGCIFTAIIQSSSATMVITLTALNAGIIELTPAAALMVGADLGTTGTVILGAFSGSSKKRQVAAAHFFFNLITDIVALVFLKWILIGAVAIAGSDNPLYALVIFYSGFNVIGILLFMPFLNTFTHFIFNLIPTTSNENQYKLDIDPLHPSSAIILLENEMFTFIDKSISLNHKLLTHKIDSKMFKQDYHHLKQIESVLITNILQLQRVSLNEIESLTIDKILNVIKNSSFSTKCLKDIEHNIQDSYELDDTRILIEKLLDVQAITLKELQIESHQIEEDINDFEDFMNFSVKFRKNYLDYINEIHLFDGSGDYSLDYSSHFNLNREIYNSCYFITIAVAQTKLKPIEYNSFLKSHSNLNLLTN
ncbi:MAG: Na/Pi cotransporter family protein [Oligoflexia bacterium]|nr:Na/Pi cotransporter family protein [Oligoflexia bacterium]